MLATEGVELEAVLPLSMPSDTALAPPPPAELSMTLHTYLSPNWFNPPKSTFGCAPAHTADASSLYFSLEAIIFERQIIERFLTASKGPVVLKLTAAGTLALIKLPSGADTSNGRKTPSFQGMS